MSLRPLFIMFIACHRIHTSLESTRLKGFIMAAPVRLMVDDRLAEDAPAGVALTVATSATPRLGWVLPLQRTGQAQTAWHVRASATGDPRVRGDLWDSGTVATSANSDVDWAGAPLQPHTHALWTVRTTDELGVVSDWATPAPLVTGPLTAADWKGQWITFPTAHSASTRFRVPGDVIRATLHFAAAGVVRAVIDDTAINPNALDPADSSLARAVSRSYDATPFLDPTATTHTVSMVATLGHYGQVLDRPRVLAELHLELEDGSTHVVATSSEWRCSPSQLISDEPFYLEEHDARRDGHGRVVGAPVALVAEDTLPVPGVVTPDAGPAVRIVREVEAALIGEPAPGVKVFDLGENLAGRVRVVVEGGDADRRIVVAHGEKLDGHGRVDSTNIRLPSDRDRERQLLAWTTAGSTESPEIISPWFAVHGFRYVEVRGLTNERIIVSAGVLHSAVEQTGWFRSSEPKLNRLVDMAMRTQLNNTHGLPEDCPTREQAGWTGDAAASVEAALAHLDLSPVYNHWLVDVALDARHGAVLGVSPHVQSEGHLQPSDPVWGAALTEIPWQQWWATGGIGHVRALLPAMRAWADWQLGTVEEGVVRNADISYGADWLALQQTPPVMLQTAAVIRSLRALADLEEALEHTAEAMIRRSQADGLSATATRILHDEVDAIWANDSQASIALALVTGLATDGERVRLQTRLSQQVVDRGNRLSSGFAGTKAVVRALAEYDGGSTLLAAVLQEEQPGIGSMLVEGPGTFWEAWWIDDENVGVASLDHIGLGAPFAAWAWQFVAGLRATEPGFRRFVVEPRLTTAVSSAAVQRMTRHGMIDVAWTARDGAFVCDVTVPVGTTADIVVPGGETVTIDSGHHSVRRAIPLLTPVVNRVESRAPRPGEIWKSSAWRPVGSDTSVEMEHEVVVCSPVFHEPIPAPTLSISIANFEPDDERWVTLHPGAPLDLTAASFAFAHVDIDGPYLTGRVVRVLLRLTSSDGTSVVAEARPLPIAWNRVSVDLSDWAGRSSVVAVDVGVRWHDEHDVGRGPFVPLPDVQRFLAMRVGLVGWTSSARTW